MLFPGMGPHYSLGSGVGGTVWWLQNTERKHLNLALLPLQMVLVGLGDKIMTVPAKQEQLFTPV